MTKLISAAFIFVFVLCDGIVDAFVQTGLIDNSYPRPARFSKPSQLVVNHRLAIFGIAVFHRPTLTSSIFAFQENHRESIAPKISVVPQGGALSDIIADDKEEVTILQVSTVDYVSTEEEMTIISSSSTSSTYSAISPATGRWLVLAAAAIYGTNFASVKLIDEIMPLEWSGAARFAVASMACMGLAKPENWNWKALSAGMIVGFWYTLAYLCHAYGLQTVDASKSAFFNALAVLVVPILDLTIRGSQLRWNQVVSLFMAVAGVALLEQVSPTSLSEALFSTSVSLPTIENFSVGDQFCLAQALFFGIGYWFLESASSENPKSADVVTFGQVVVVSVGFALVGSFRLNDFVGVQGAGDVLEKLQHIKYHLPSRTMVLSWITQPWLMAGILWTGIASTASALYMETLAMQSIAASELTMIMTSVSIWGGAFAFVTIGEVPTKESLAGGVLIILGCILSTIDTQQDEER